METEDDAAGPMTLCAKVCGVRELAMAILEHLACPSLGQLAGACRDLRALADEDSLWAALAERRWRLASVQRRATRPRGPAAARFDDCASTAAATQSFHSPFLHGARSWRQTYRQLHARLQTPRTPWTQRHHALFARGRGAGVDCFVCVNHTADCRTLGGGGGGAAAGGAGAGGAAVPGLPSGMPPQLRAHLERMLPQIQRVLQGAQNAAQNGGEFGPQVAAAAAAAAPAAASLAAALSANRAAMSANRDALDAAILADAAAVGAEQAAAAEPAPRRRGRRGAIDGGQPAAVADDAPAPAAARASRSRKRERPAPDAAGGGAGSDRQLRPRRRGGDGGGASA